MLKNENINLFASHLCYGRLSEILFGELESLDDLITKMGTTKDGFKISGVDEPHIFKQRLESFREFLKTEFPEFTEEDILTFSNLFQKFKKIYEWHGVEYLLAAMEYESRKKTF